MRTKDERKLLHILEESYVLDMYAGGGGGPLCTAFHPEFRILIPAFDGRTGRVQDVEWIQPVEGPEPRAASPRRSFEVSVLDITGKIAVCKVEAFHDRRLEYTDYVTFTKIDQDWKVVSKVFHRHGLATRAGLAG